MRSTLGIALVLLLGAVPAFGLPESRLAEPAAAHRVGTFAASLAVAPDEIASAELRRRFPRERSRQPVTIDPRAERFRIHVPGHYAPEGRREPKPDGSIPSFGVLVWISPTDSGAVPEAYAPLLAEHDLLWIGADNAGNERLAHERLALALCAAVNMQLLYDIDPDRIYVAGLSGGGRLASIAATNASELFRGGAPLMGCNFHERVPVPGDPSMGWPPCSEPSPFHAAIAKRQPLVIVTGEKDFNREQCEVYAEAYRAEGYEVVEYVELEGVGHELPGTEAMDDILALLEKRPPATPRTARKEADAAERLAAVRELLGDDDPGNDRRAESLLEDAARRYAGTPAGNRAAQLQLRRKYGASDGDTTEDGA